MLSNAKRAALLAAGYEIDGQWVRKGGEPVGTLSYAIRPSVTPEQAVWWYKQLDLRVWRVLQDAADIAERMDYL